MRVLLNWKWRGDEMARKLIEAGHEVPYVVALEEEKIKKAIPNVIFHNKRAAQKAIAADGIDCNVFLPPSKELISKLHEAESIVLTMMNRRESNLSVDERRRIYYWHLRYWLGVIEKFKIDAVVFDDVPHAANTFVAYSLAKILNLRTVMIQKIRISDRLLVYNDWQKGSEELDRAVEKYLGKSVKLADLSPDIVASCNLSDKELDQPLYEKYFPPAKPFFKKVTSKVRTIFSSAIFGKVKDLAKHKIKVWITGRKIGIIRKEYEQMTKQPGFDQPFVYFPLHYQPERNSCPQGGVFSDQLLAVEILASALPEGWKLYVKEHPDQWHPSRVESVASVRYRGYYRHIADLKNVFLIPMTADPIELVKKAGVIATLTGTAGFEALLNEKPVLVFGYPWYMHYPEVFRITDNESARRSLLAVKNGFRPKRQTMLNFLKAFEEVSVRGYIGFKTKWGTNSAFSEVESMDEIVNAVIKNLQSVK